MKTQTKLSVVILCGMVLGLPPQAWAGVVDRAAIAAMERARAAERAAEVARLNQQRARLAQAENARRQYAAMQQTRAREAYAAQKVAQERNLASVVKMRTLPPIANDVRRTAGTGLKAARAETLAKNRISGKVAELNAVHDLKNRGYTVLGTQVSARSGDSLRRIDVLAKSSEGRIFAGEVKWGNAGRTAAQSTFDTRMADSGATLVGKNAPSGMVNTGLKTPTVELRY